MTNRIRGRKLQATRARVLRDGPLCAMCQQKGIVTLAAEVDHIVPLHKGGDDDASNMQGLCHDCHADKTRADLGQSERIKFDSSGRVVW